MPQPGILTWLSEDYGSVEYDAARSSSGRRPHSPRYVKLAELYDSQGNQAQVESLLKQLDSMSEGELAIGLARARICLNHADTECAQRNLRDLSNRYPTNAEVLIMLGDLEFRLKNYEQALDCYRRAGGGWFGDAKDHLSMAKSLNALGRSREARDQCSLARALILATALSGSPAPR